MNNHEIKIDNYFTSYVFYNNFLEELHHFFRGDFKETQVIINLTHCLKIDALIIPNLLLVGKIIKEYTNVTPYLYIADMLQTGDLKRYLKDINFISIAKLYKLYEFDYSIDCGLPPSKMDNLNKTIYFPYETNSQIIWDEITKVMELFSKKYLYKYKVIFNKDEIENTGNILMNICSQLVDNAREHGESISIMTIQYNYSEEKVKISISDMGNGFKKTVNRNLSNGRIEYGLGFNSTNDELKAIIQGVFSRKNSTVYGIYNTIKTTAENDGIVRIHSRDSQVIFTSKLWDELNKFDYQTVLKDKKWKKNFRKVNKYQGVHIEYEIPLVKTEVQYIEEVEK
jgi:hypothetical protein